MCMHVCVFICLFFQESSKEVLKVTHTASSAVICTDHAPTVDIVLKGTFPLIVVMVCGFGLWILWFLNSELCFII